MAKQYGAEDIKILDGLKPVRQTPAMFIGDTGPKGLHHLIWEVVDNAVDERLAGHCKEVEVILHVDGSVSVKDDGRGIPVDIHPQKKVPAVEVVLTVLHAGGKFDKQNYAVSGGLHGVGVSVVNALSEWLKVTIWRDGFEWTQSYERGTPTNSLQKGKSIPKSRTGTTIRFKPDADVFKQTHDFNIEVVRRRMMEIAFLEPGLKISLLDEKTGKDEVFHFDGGLTSYVEYVNEDKDGVFPNAPVLFDGESEEMKMSLSMAWQYTNQIGENTLSYTNIIPTTEGGTHVAGFRGGMTRAINTWARAKEILKEKDKNLDGQDIREGITVVISLKMSTQPQFEGQTKSKLGNPEVEAFVSQVVCEKMTQYLDENEKIGKRIVEAAQLSRKAREEARAVSDRIKRKGPLGAHRLPGKLADCNVRDPERCELFIVEGDSAMGPAKETRDAQTQAIFPIRGKIRNVEKVSLADALRNEEIMSLISCLGTGFVGANGNDDEDDEGNNGFSVDKLRYNKIILLTDADTDGKHIQILLLTFFFRFMRPLIEAGHIYISEPPLYSLEIGNRNHYAWNESELKELQEKYKTGDVRRFKGLGQMTADGLGLTAIHPATRRIHRIEIENVGDSDKLIGHLMGVDVGPRKEFLDLHAAEYYEKVFEII